MVVAVFMPLNNLRWFAGAASAIKRHVMTAISIDGGGHATNVPHFVLSQMTTRPAFLALWQSFDAAASHEAVKTSYLQTPFVIYRASSIVGAPVRPGAQFAVLRDSATPYSCWDYSMAVSIHTNPKIF